MQGTYPRNESRPRNHYMRRGGVSDRKIGDIVSTLTARSLITLLLLAALFQRENAHSCTRPSFVEPKPVVLISATKIVSTEYGYIHCRGHDAMGFRISKHWSRRVGG